MTTEQLTAKWTGNESRIQTGNGINYTSINVLTNKKLKIKNLEFFGLNKKVMRAQFIAATDKLPFLERCLYKQVNMTSNTDINLGIKQSTKCT